MKCSNCGAELEYGKFCPHCGTKINGEENVIAVQSDQADTDKKIENEKVSKGEKIWDRFVTIRYWAVTISGIVIGLYFLSEDNIGGAVLCFIAAVLFCPEFQGGFSWGKQIIIRIVAILIISFASITSGEDADLGEEIGDEIDDEIDEEMGDEEEVDDSGFDSEWYKKESIYINKDTGVELEIVYNEDTDSAGLMVDELNWGELHMDYYTYDKESGGYEYDFFIYYPEKHEVYMPYGEYDGGDVTGSYYAK